LRSPDRFRGPVRIGCAPRVECAEGYGLSGQAARDDQGHPSFGAIRRQPPASEKYLGGSFGGLAGFELKGGLKAGWRFIDALELLYHVANIVVVENLNVLLRKMA
jgi:hypothetical protein